MTSPTKHPGRAEETAARRAERERREAEALRANLHRRKQQRRAREEAQDKPPVPSAPEPG